MTDYADLVKRMRATESEFMSSVADAIEALVKENAKLKEALEFISRGTTGSPDAIIARRALEDEE